MTVKQDLKFIKSRRRVNLFRENEKQIKEFFYKCVQVQGTLSEQGNSPKNIVFPPISTSISNRSST